MKQSILIYVDSGYLEKYGIDSCNHLRIKTPFWISFGDAIIEWLYCNISCDYEIGGIMGCYPKKDSNGDIWLYVDKVHLVTNVSKHQKYEYRPNMRSWKYAIKAMLKLSPCRLPLAFHTHPTGANNIIGKLIQHDDNFGISDKDMDSSFEFVNIDNILLKIPQLLIAKRTKPLYGIFAGIYGSEITDVELQREYKKEIIEHRVESLNKMIDTIVDISKTDRVKKIVGIAGISLLAGFIVAPKPTCELVFNSGASVAAAIYQTAFENIDNKGNSSYFAFTSVRGPSSVLIFQVPYYSMKYRPASPLINYVKSKRRKL